PDPCCVCSSMRSPPDDYCNLPVPLSYCRGGPKRRLAEWNWHACGDALAVDNSREPSLVSAKLRNAPAVTAPRGARPGFHRCRSVGGRRATMAVGRKRLGGAFLGSPRATSIR